jgi:hypothetical protein
MDDKCYDSKEKFKNSVTGHIPRVLLESYETQTLVWRQGGDIYLYSRWYISVGFVRLGNAIRTKEVVWSEH